MEEEIQQVANRLKSFKGNTKGEAVIADIKYIKFKEGEDGARRLEEKMKELGMTVNFDTIKPYEWFNEGVSATIIVAAKEIFNWTEKDVFEMGKTAPKISFLVKLMVRHFFSFETLVQNIDKYWKKHYDFGSLSPVHPISENKIILKEEGYNLHPLLCTYHAGYYQAICEFALRDKNITVRETACVHRGNEYNEYTIEWN